MAGEQKTTEPPAEGTPKAVQAATMKLGDLRRMIGDMVDAGVKAAIGDREAAPPQESPTRPVRRQQQPEPQRRSVEDEVSAALTKIESAKERERLEAQRDADIADLKEKVKERPPLERSRRHRFMGWGEPG